MHLGGKLEVIPEVPLQATATTSPAPTRPAWPASAWPSRRTPRTPAASPSSATPSPSSPTAPPSSASATSARHAALPVMEGKAALFKQFAGVDAWPVCLDTQDTEEIIRDRQGASPRSTAASTSRTSPPRAASRSSAGCATSSTSRSSTTTSTAPRSWSSPPSPTRSRSSGKQLEDVRVVVSGVGAAGHAIITLLHAQGVGHIVACDRNGALHSGQEHQEPARRWIAENTNGDGQRRHAGRGRSPAPTSSSASRRPSCSPARTSPRWPTTPSSSPSPTPTRRSTRWRPASTPPSWRPAARDFPNQINNVLAFPGFFRGHARRGRPRDHRGGHARRRPAIADVRRAGRAQRSYIVPSVFDPAVAPAVAARGPRRRNPPGQRLAGGRRGRPRARGHRSRVPAARTMEGVTSAR